MIIGSEWFPFTGFWVRAMDIQLDNYMKNDMYFGPKVT